MILDPRAVRLAFVLTCELALLLWLLGARYGVAIVSNYRG